MKVLKFGGSSLASPDCVNRVTQIVAAAGDRILVVVSALGGATDELLALGRRAAAGEPTLEGLRRLRERHETSAAALAAEADLPAIQATISERFDELERLLEGIAALGEASERTLDSVLATGELVSSEIVAAALRADGQDAAAVDARKLIRTDRTFGAARIDEDATFARIREQLADPPSIPVVTGFIAADARGDTTTLGRGGSDYTASLLGAALDAEAVELWTDVDGVMSADPRLVPEAVPIARIRYDELMELSHFGAKVVHPPSVHPTRARSIPLHIKNTFRPEAPGTIVRDRFDEATTRPVTGVASIGPVTLLRLEGDGMVGVPGISMRLFGALAREDVSVILISQASSEHSICFAVAPEAIERVTRSVEREFEPERRAGLGDALVVENDLAVLAVVGRGMREHPGIAARVFGALGRRGLNVRAIAQGSSELNISLVVRRDQEARAVHAVHDSFFLAGTKTVDVAVAGVGGVGDALLQQIAANRADLARRERIDLRLVGVAGRRGAFVDRDGLDPETAIDRMRASEDDLVPLPDLLGSLRDERRSLRILVDCTASDTVSEHFEELLQHGVSVVTANKRPIAGTQSSYDSLRTPRPGRLYYETTVGAGLPVIRTIQDLVATGDRITRVEGVLSGTLSYLVGSLRAGRTFRDALEDARSMGFTEPDPREDLGGADVVRKLVILGREAGLVLEPESVEVEPLLPQELFELPLDRFWDELASLDEPMAERQASAAANGRALAYLATVDASGARVALTEVEADHSCARLRPGDNAIAVTSERYADAPLIVSGPGAGPIVTAAGVFADILRAIVETEEPQP